MLLLRNDDTGVEMSSLPAVLGVLLSGRGVLCDNGVVAVDGAVEPATFGVRGVRAAGLARLGAILGAFAFGFSNIFEFAFPDLARGAIGGDLIVAF